MMRLIYIFILLAAATCAFAQDPHHSQYFNLQPLYNPASAGHNVEHIRAVAVYRQQWPSIASPFITQGLLFDKQVSRVGFGALINSNTSGASGIKRMQFGGMISYRQKLESHQLAVGVYTGFIQKSFDPSEMTFDDQYIDDAGYSPSHVTSEEFAFTKVTRPDFGAGFLWSMGEEENKRLQPFAGGSIMHINQPHEVFIEEMNITPMKKSITAGARYLINDNLSIKPSGLYSLQQASSEIIYGCLTTLHFEERTAAEAGIYIRHGESAIAYAGYRWNSFHAGMSYDLTLSNSVNGPGAFEVTLTYIPKQKIKKEKKKPATSHEQKPKSEPAEADKVVKKDETKSINTQPAVPAKASAKPIEKKTETRASGKPVENNPVTKSTDKAVEKKAEIKSSDKPVEKQTENKSSEKIINKPHEHKQGVDPAKNVSNPAKTVESPKAEQKPATVSKKTNEESIPAEKAKPVEKVSPAKAPVTTAPPAIVKNEKVKEIKKEEVLPDRDKDGVADRDDNCPDEPGLASDKGCPSKTANTDSDGDGVLNADDKCPFIKGDKSTHGCPDTDGDGIIDAEDNCPMHKGDLKNKGCPDIDMHSKDVYIKFEINSARISGFDIIDILEPVSDSLFYDSTLKLIIAGHTDSEGDELYNMILSQNRADAVKAYFAKHGVPEQNIQTIGYGETRPVEPNETEAGRKRNRRAEIYIVK